MVNASTSTTTRTTNTDVAAVRRSIITIRNNNQKTKKWCYWIRPIRTVPVLMLYTIPIVVISTWIVLVYQNYESIISFSTSTYPTSLLHLTSSNGSSSNNNNWINSNLNVLGTSKRTATITTETIKQQQHSKLHHPGMDGTRGKGSSSSSSSSSSRRKQKQQEQQHQSSSSYFFNNIPIQPMNGYPPISRIQCVSHNHHQYNNNDNDFNERSSSSSSSWMSTSCSYTNLCLDLQEKEYVRFVYAKKNKNSGSTTNDINNNKNNYDDDDEEDTEDNPYVAIGGINPRWLVNSTIPTTNNIINKNENANNNNDRGAYKVRWKPKLIFISLQVQQEHNDNNDINTTTFNNNKHSMYNYYQLPSNSTLIPFHSMAGHNVGHLLWDDLYPIYSLLKMFGHEYVVTDTSVAYDESTTKSHNVHQQQQQPQQLLLLRHKLIQPQSNSNNNHSTEPILLYATCDIRRNKRIGCKENFNKFLPLFGILPSTFSTQATAAITTLNATTTTNNYNNNGRNSIRYVCAKRALAGLGLLTDHGYNDHGWDTPRNRLNRIYYKGNNDVNNNIDNNNNRYNLILPPLPPHNLGRGRQLYEFRNFLMNNAQKYLGLPSRSRPHDEEIVVTDAGRTKPMSSSLSSSLETITTTPKTKAIIIRITFSLRSSRDWNRRLNFTKHIAALKKLQREEVSNTVPTTNIINIGSINNVNILLQIESYEFRELTLIEQLQIAEQSDIFITAVGGGAITGMFLRRHTCLILYYDPIGGFDFYTFQSNHQPARLDYDLYTNTPHLRVHWLPTISTNNVTSETTFTEQNNVNDHDYDDHGIELFVRLIQHEISMIRTLRSNR